MKVILKPTVCSLKEVAVELDALFEATNAINGHIRPYELFKLSHHLLCVRGVSVPLFHVFAYDVPKFCSCIAKCRRWVEVLGICKALVIGKTCNDSQSMSRFDVGPWLGRRGNIQFLR